MDSRFIRLNPEEAIWIKSNLNSSQTSFENILKHVLSYQLLRKKESILKNKLKASLAQLRSKINQIELNFPEAERRDVYESEKSKKHHHLTYNQIESHNHQILEPNFPHRLNHLHKMIQHEKNRNVDEELNDIKKKLEKLQR